MTGRRSVLEVSGLTRRFGGIAAVDNVDLVIEKRERRGIIGPNGAGKTTLFRLLSGETKPDAGRIRLFGEDVTRLSTHRRARLGLGRTYQITNIFKALTVRQNLELAVLRSLGLAYSPFWGRNRQLVDERVDDTLDMSRIDHIAGTSAAEISHGEQRQVELAIALAARPHILLLDEPAAGLSAAERSEMANTIQELPPDITICLIEHDMDLALGLSDTVTCLHYGKVIATGDPDEIRNNDEVQNVYLGSSR